jgi:hypothetical protein
MAAHKGHKKAGGRAPGVVNKVTADLRHAIMHAFDTVGGEAYLVHVARARPDLFCMLLARILPLQVTGKNGGPIETADASARERIEGRIARIRDRMEEDKNPRRLVP